MSGKFAAALCVLVASATTFAQEEKKQPPGGGRGGGQFGRMGAGAGFAVLLGMKEVQEDLKLSDEEKTELEKLRTELTDGDRKSREELRDASPEDRREKMTAHRTEVEKQVKEALGDKYTRFRQIKLQLDGVFMSAMMDNEVREKLEITEEQRMQFGEEMRGMFQPGGDQPSAEEREKKMQEVVDKVLTAEQKKKWEEMVGAKVTYKRPPPPAGGRRPGGDNQKPPV